MVLLNPTLTVYQRKLTKRAKRISEISPISHISFLLCANKYTKPNIQQNHFFNFLQNLSAFQESSKRLLQTFLFYLDVTDMSIAPQIIVRKQLAFGFFLWFLIQKRITNQTISEKPQS